jgi:acyl carrier protein
VELPTDPWQRRRLWKEDFHPWNRDRVPHKHEVDEPAPEILTTGQPPSLNTIRTEITHIVARATKAPSEEVDTDQPLQELGIDSPLTIQIRDAIVQRFGSPIPLTAFWTHPTIESFSRYLAAALGVDCAPKGADSTVDVHAELQKKWNKYL